MTYRPDIDGLRAIAVLAVVLFHADVPGFGGGYVGVDVFFVISGYLIAGLLLEEQKAGQMSIIRFYERRIRRIFPALFATLAACTVLACALMLPGDLAAFGRSLLAATLFVSNFFFWRESGYFVAPAELKPLLHTWSLAVEEQFYIFFPIYLILLARVSPRLRMSLTLALLLISLIVSEWLVWNTVRGFFLTPARAYELLLGACLAMGAAPPLTGRLQREAAALLGLAMIATSIVLFSPDTLFPGLNALVPCLGTVLMICAGAGERPSVNRVLAKRPVVFIGLISYSLYLWHWPILVFAKYYLIRNLSALETTLLIALSLLISAASWRYIERPFRGRQPLLNRPATFGVAGSVAAVTCVMATLLVLSQGWPARLPSDVVELAASDRDGQPAAEQCENRRAYQVEQRELCLLGDDTEPQPSFLVWGDSHAEALASAIDRAARQAGRSGWQAAQPGCPSLFGVAQWRPGFREPCLGLNRAVQELLADTSSIDTVFLISRWANYVIGENYGGERGHLTLIGTENAREYSLSANVQVFEEGLRRTVAWLEQHGKRPVVVAQVPEIGWDVPSVLARAKLFGKSLEIEPTVDDYLARQQPVHRVFDDARERLGFTILYPHQILCTAAVCEVRRDGHLLYFDDDHVSHFGSSLLTGMFRAVLDEDLKDDALRAESDDAG